MKKNFYLPNTRAAVLTTVLLISFSLSSGAQGLVEYLRGNLYVMQNGSPVLIDGNLTHYHSANNNTVDYNDARKMTNPGENFGILRNGVTLAIERRNIFTIADTTFFRMWNLRQQQYMVEFIASNLNHPNVNAFVVDKYLKRRFPLNCNGTTRINVNVDSDPRSYDETRFSVVFRQNTPSIFPIKFSGLRLKGVSGNLANVEWDVTVEYDVEKYELQKSFDGLQFETIEEIVPFNEGVGQTYSALDNNCIDEAYYRVKGSRLNGEVFYSSIARLKPFSEVGEISVFPNPVANKEVQLYMNEPLPGQYTVMLLGTNGQTRSRSIIKVGEGQNLNRVGLPPSTAPGIYLLQIIRPDNTRVTKTIAVL